MHARNIQRPAQCLCRRNSTLVCHIIVLRSETIDIHRSIGNERVGEQRSVTQCVAIQEWLQYAARTARSPGYIDIDTGPFPFGRSIAAVRNHLALRYFHHDSRQVSDALRRQLRIFPRKNLLDPTLQIQVNVCPYVFSFVFRRQLVHEVHCMRRQRNRGGRKRLRTSQAAFVRG